MTTFSFKIRLSLFLSLIICGCLFAQEKEGLKILKVEYFNVDQGLHNNRIFDAIIDFKGFIWVINSEGLQYWDGDEFVPDSNIISSRYHETFLYDISTGVFVLNEYKLLYKESISDTFELLYKFDDPDRFAVSKLSENSDTLLVLDGDKVFKYHSSKGFYDRTELIPKTNEQSVGAFNSSNGDSFIYLKSGQSIYINNGLDRIDFSANRYSFSHTDSISLHAGKDQLNIIENGGVKVFTYPNQIKSVYYTSIAKHTDSTVLLGVDDVLLEFDYENDRWLSPFQFANAGTSLELGYFDKILKDSFNNIWVVNVINGLTKLSQQMEFNNMDFSKLSDPSVKSFAINPASKEIFVVGLKGDLYYSTNRSSTFQKVDLSQAIKDGSKVTGVYHLMKDDYLLIVNQDPRVFLIQYNENEGLKWKVIGERNNDYVYYQSSERSSEYLYLGLDQVYKVDLESYEFTEEDYTVASIFSSCHDAGQIYYGSNNGIIKFDFFDKSYSWLPLEDFAYIRAINKWSKDTLLVGGDFGVYKYDLQSFDRVKLSASTAYSLELDKDSSIWVGSNSGLLCLLKDGGNLDYTKDDGVLDLEFNTNASWKDQEGKLYFGGLNGITSFLPKEMPKRYYKPKVYLKSILVDNKELQRYTDFDPRAEIVLPFQNNNILIELGVLGHDKSSNYLFKDRINNKVNFNESRNNPRFSYTLAPGTYSFEYKVGHRHMMLDETFKLNIKILNPWWKSGVFYFLILSGASVVLLLFAYQFYKRRRLKDKMEWEAIYEIQNQKIKLSRDLHDSIGSQLSYLVSSIENVKLEKPENIDLEIDKISDYSRTIITELRSIIWVLHKDAISYEEFDIKIFDLIRKVSSSSLSIDYIPKHTGSELISSEMAANLFHIIQELLHNTFKHSSASLVNIVITSNDKILAVSYTDNGVGFDVNAHNEGYGLRNIKKRTKQLGGKMFIESILGEGVEANINISLIT